MFAETLDRKTRNTSPVLWAQVQVTDTFGLEDDVLVSIRYGTVRLGFCAFSMRLKTKEGLEEVLSLSFSTPSVDWKISKFPEIQNSSKVINQTARRQAPLESVKSHPFKFPAQLEELSNLVRVMERWVHFGEAFRYHPAF